MDYEKLQHGRSLICGSSQRSQCRILSRRTIRSYVKSTQTTTRHHRQTMVLHVSPSKNRPCTKIQHSNPQDRSISYTSSTMLLFTLSQQLLRSSPHIQNKTTFKPAWESLKCLQLCASKDHAAKVLYSRLQPHIAVIQAERLRISTLPRQLPLDDGHLFAIPSGDSALYRTAHALLDLVAQPFPIITGDGGYSVMDE